MLLDLGTLLGIISFMLALNVALDIIVSDYLKQNFVISITGSLSNRETSTKYDAYILATRAFGYLFGTRVFSIAFLVRSFILTTIFLACLTAAKCLIDPTYYYQVLSAISTNSSLLDIAAIMLLGILLSDCICFSKTIFFVSLFDKRANFLGGLTLALADFTLSILIYVTILGLAFSFSVIIFDATRNTIVSADIYIHSYLDFSNISPDNLPSSSQSSKEEISNEHNKQNVLDSETTDTDWTFIPSNDMTAWQKQIGSRTTLMFGDAETEWSDLAFIKTPSSIKDFLDYLIKTQNENAEKFKVNTCGNINYKIIEQSKHENEINIAFIRYDNEIIRDIKVTVPVQSARVEISFNHTISRKRFFDIWGIGSKYFIDQYVFIIQSMGRTVDVISFKDFYSSYLRSVCHWESGMREAFLNKFVKIATIDGYWAAIERYAIPVGAFPYAGLAATIFFHSLAALIYLGRILLPRRSSFFKPPTEAPFTIIAVTGSLLTLAIYFALWFGVKMMNSIE